MRNTQKWLVLLMTVAMLVNVLGVTAMATESWAPLELQVVPAAEGGMVQVNILATETQIVADGKLVVTYDPAVLTYEDTKIGDAWADTEDMVLSENAMDGKIILAFASAAAAEDGVLFSIDFSGFVCDAQIDLVGSDSYITGTGPVPAIGGKFCPSDRFVDVRNLSDESHEAVDYMVGNGYMNGMADDQFGPGLQLTRAMMVTILHRVAGLPSTESELIFTDVPENAYFTDAVIWAYENGITDGVSLDKFAPDKALSRQEMVTFLYRFAGYMNYDRTATADLSGFTDAGSVKQFAVVPFQWAVAEGIITGTSDTTLDPLATTTREQVVLVVYRLLSQQD